MAKALYKGDGYRTALTTGKIYNFSKQKDEFGDYYSIMDDSGEWYRYSVEYFEGHFEIL